MFHDILGMNDKNFMLNSFTHVDHVFLLLKNLQQSLTNYNFDEITHILFQISKTVSAAADLSSIEFDQEILSILKSILFQEFDSVPQKTELVFSILNIIFNFLMKKADSLTIILEVITIDDLSFFLQQTLSSDFPYIVKVMLGILNQLFLVPECCQLILSNNLLQFLFERIDLEFQKLSPNLEVIYTICHSISFLVYHSNKEVCETLSDHIIHLYNTMESQITNYNFIEPLFSVFSEFSQQLPDVLLKSTNILQTSTELLFTTEITNLNLFNNLCLTIDFLISNDASYYSQIQSYPIFQRLIEILDFHKNSKKNLTNFIVLFRTVIAIDHCAVSFFLDDSVCAFFSELFQNTYSKACIKISLLFIDISNSITPSEFDKYFRQHLSIILSIFDQDEFTIENKLIHDFSSFLHSFCTKFCLTDEENQNIIDTLQCYNDDNYSQVILDLISFLSPIID